MKLVALTQRVALERGERRDALDRRWVSFCAAAGLLPLPLPNDARAARALLGAARPVGAILTGGGDLADYGGDTPERDAVEAALFAWAAAGRRPLLGVCRGAQALLHRYETPLVRVEGHIGTRHRVTWRGGVRRVNSWHGWGARSLAAPLEALALSPDGGVEAFRHRSLPVVGLMWHPERERTPDPRDLGTVRDLFGGRR